MLLYIGYFFFPRTYIRQVLFLFGQRVDFIISTGAFFYFLIFDIADSHFSWWFCCCWSSILRISRGNDAHFFLLLLVSLECVLGLLGVIAACFYVLSWRHYSCRFYFIYLVLINKYKGLKILSVSVLMPFFYSNVYVVGETERIVFMCYWCHSF